MLPRPSASMSYQWHHCSARFAKLKTHKLPGKTESGHLNLSWVKLCLTTMIKLRFYVSISTRCSRWWLKNVDDRTVPLIIAKTNIDLARKICIFFDFETEGGHFSGLCFLSRQSVRISTNWESARFCVEWILYHTWLQYFTNKQFQPFFAACFYVVTNVAKQENDAKSVRWAQPCWEIHSPLTIKGVMVGLCWIMRELRFEQNSKSRGSRAGPSLSSVSVYCERCINCVGQAQKPRFRSTKPIRTPTDQIVR